MRNIIKNSFAFCSILLFSSVSISAPARASSAIGNVSAALLDLIRANPSTMPPPKASRAIAMVEIAMYDSVNAATGLRYDAYSYAGPKVVGLSSDAVAYVAGYTMLANLFPAEAANLDAAMNASLASLGLSAGQINRNTTLANEITGTLFASRSADGASTAQTFYTFGSGPGAFQSVAGGAQPALPSWGLVDPFVLASGDQFRLGAPPALGSAQWIADYNQVRTIGCNTCGTAWQQETALFWADNGGTLTPPGHWLAIASDLSGSQGLGLMDEARLMAMVGASVADAGIAAWDTKYTYDFWRPITAIQNCTMADCGVDGDPNWTPFLGTPNFPTYVSGHSTFSSAGAAALGAFFGTDAMSFCVDSDSIVGLATRCYDSFSSAAAEAGISRIYGGIHYEFDDGPALGMGDRIGNYVAGNAFGFQGMVPEPTNWAMMVAGFGMIGSVVRRRRTLTTA